MFNYDENALNDMLSMVTENIGNMSNMEDGYLDNMSSISKSGSYGNGIEMIDSQIVSIKDGLTDFKNITNSNARAIEELEKRLKSEVEDIELPKDFDASDVGVNVQTSDITLSKNDGLSVNPSVLGGNSEYQDDYDKDLKNIYDLSKSEVSESSLEDYEKTITNELENVNVGVVNESIMEDVKESKEIDLSKVKDGDTEEESLKDFKETKEVELTDELKEEDNVNSTELDDYAYTEKINLEDARGDDNDNQGEL